LTRSQFERDLEEEMRLHVELREERLRATGAPDEGARQAARHRFGNTLRLREESIDAWGWRWLEQVFQDMRYGLRTFRRQLTVPLVVTLTLAAGVGMNTAVFSVFEAVLLRPLPFPEPQRLVWLTNHDPQFGQDTFVSRSDVMLWRERTRLFQQIGAYGHQDLAVSAPGGVVQQRVTSISPEMWQLTGARAPLGRLFGGDEPDAVVLSYAAFERQFRGDVSVVGKSVTLNGYPVTIVGVLTREFRLALPTPLGMDVKEPAMYLPLPTAFRRAGVPDPPDPSRAPSPPWVMVVAKLRPNITVDAARAELQGVYGRIAEEFPLPLRRGRILGVQLLQDKIVGPTEVALTLLMTAVGFVLLIATTNIAHLLTARALMRRSEIAIRTALGASRVRIVRQLVSENALIAAGGCIVGLLVAKVVLDGITVAWPEAVPRLHEATMNAPVLAFGIGIALISTFLFGLAPAMALLRTEVTSTLKSSERSLSPTRGARRMRRLLVGFELAVATALLVGATLLLKSFWVMNSGSATPNPNRILIAQISLVGPRYDDRLAQEQYVQELLRRVSGAPGVSHIAGIDAGSLNANIKIDGRSPALSEGGTEPAVALKPVSLGFLRAMGVPLVAGEWPSEEAMNSHASESTGALLVNERFVRVIMGNEDPIGHHVSGPFVSGTIAGVVGDFKDWRLDSDPVPQVYMPFRRAVALRSARLVLRTNQDSAAVLPVVREVAADIDRTQPVLELATLADVLASSVTNQRFNLTLLGSFAAVAVALALIGAYGVIAYSVAQRRREIGVRIALGAKPHQVVRMILGHELGVAFAGIVVGLAASLMLSPLIANLLYGIVPRDPATFVGVAMGLAAAATVTALIGAAGAASVDPIKALQNG
jgi:predicted permease